MKSEDLKPLSGVELVPWEEGIPIEDLEEEYHKHARVEWEAHGHWVSFVVAEISYEAGSSAKVLRSPLAHGELKWDGCLHFYLEEESCYFHFCGPEEGPFLGRLIKTIYALGPKLPSWDYIPRPDPAEAVVPTLEALTENLRGVSMPPSEAYELVQKATEAFNKLLDVVAESTSNYPKEIPHGS